MSISIAALPAKTLQKLKEGPTICVQYKPTPTSEPLILDSNFSKAVAKAFSSKWSALFPRINQLAATELHKAQPTVLTITGGSKAMHLFVLDWMRSCCAGKGVQPIPEIAPRDKPFSQYFFLKESATLIGCSYLETKLENRMRAISAKQIHSEDVRALYKDLPAGHVILDFLAEHVAMLIWNGELKARPAYETLRQEIPQFNTDINAVLNPLVAKRHEEQKAEREEHFRKVREERRAQSQKDAQNRKMGGKKHGKKVVVQTPEEVEAADAGVKKPVPGAEEHSSTPSYKNKAAKRRAKKREEKATEALE